MSHLNIAEAVPLGYAMVARVAQDAGVRALAIKGPLLSLQGLREAKLSVDVDILVEHTGEELLRHGLVNLGWQDSIPTTGATIVPQHSVTLSNARWPIQIDLHGHFPGLFGDQEANFDLLWRRSERLPVAHQLVATPCRVDSHMIHMLHLLRDPDRNQRSIESICRDGPSILSRAEMTDLAVIAGRTGAHVPLADYLRETGAIQSGGSHMTLSHVDADEVLAWRVRQASRGVPAVPGLFALASASWRERPAIFWANLMLTRQEIFAQYPQFESQRMGATKGRVRRAMRGLRHIWAAAKIVRAVRG